MDIGREATLLVLSALYALMGVFLLSVAYKIFDWMTPNDLGEQIFHGNNVAAAIMAGAFLIALGLIIAAAIGG